MIVFRNGPAAGVVLALSLAPDFLRVVRDDASIGLWAFADGGVSTPNDEAWDALDHADDKPLRFERVWAYRRVAPARLMWVDEMWPAGISRRGWRCASADYDFIDAQPREFALRDNAAWCAWVSAQTPLEVAS